MNEVHGTTSDTSGKPEFALRIGNMSVSVFANAVSGDGGATRTVRSVVLQRRYYDRQQGAWRTAKNIGGLVEIGSAIRLLELTRQYLESKELSDVPF
jgi:hypothetical protein